MVALLWVVAALNYLDRILLTTMHASLEAAIPMTEAQFGLLSSGFLWVYAFSSPIAGYLADRFRRSTVIVVSLLVWSAMTWLTGHAHTYGQLLTVRALMGISEASYLPAALALIADYHSTSTRSLATGIHMTGISAGSALGGLGGWMAEQQSWHFVFSLFGGIGVAYSLVLCATLRESPHRRVSGAMVGGRAPIRVGAVFGLLWGSAGFRLLLAYWGLLGVVGWLIVGWMPTYLNEQFHLTQGSAGVSSTTYLQFAALLGGLIGGAWADRWSRANARSPFWVTAIGLALAAPGLLIAGTTSLLPLAVAGLILYGLTRYFADSNLLAMLCVVVPAEGRATGYGLLNCCGCLAGGIGIYLAGSLRDARIGLGPIFAGAAALAWISAAIVVWIGWRSLRAEKRRIARS